MPAASELVISILIVHAVLRHGCCAVHPEMPYLVKAFHADLRGHTDVGEVAGLLVGSRMWWSQQLLPPELDSAAPKPFWQILPQTAQQMWFLACQAAGVDGLSEAISDVSYSSSAAC